MQRQTAVTVYLKSKHLLLFVSGLKHKSSLHHTYTALAMLTLLVIMHQNNNSWYGQANAKLVSNFCEVHPPPPIIM